MSKTDNLIEFLTGIADAIREVKGTNALINPQNFRSEVEGLSAEQPQLYAPTIALSDTYVTITNNANNGSFVEHFDICVDGVDAGTVASTISRFAWSNYINDFGEITVTAKGTNFIDSSVSNSVMIGADIVGGLYGVDGSFTPWSRLVSDGVITMDGTTVTSSDAGIAGELMIPSNGSVTEIGDNAFRSRTGLTKVEIPEGITKIGKEAFRHCSELTNISIPNSLMYLGDAALANCSNLNYKEEGVVRYIGNELNPYVVAHRIIDSDATVVNLNSYTLHIHTYFCNSTFNLQFVNIPDGVIGIGSNSFTNVKFTSITIPNSVIYIGTEAFNSSKITTIIYKGTKVQWNAIDKASNWDKWMQSYTIRCTDGNI